MLCCCVWHHILLLLLYWTLGTTGAVCARALFPWDCWRGLRARALEPSLLWLPLTVTFAALGIAGAHSLRARALPLGLLEFAQVFILSVVILIKARKKIR